MKSKMRKHLSIVGLLETVRDSYVGIKESAKRGNGYSLVDCLMSGIAVFGQKHASLLQFDESRNDDIARHNLKSLYNVKKAPCDTYLRQRLDEVDPSSLDNAFSACVRSVQRGKALSHFSFMDDAYLVSIDGTGIFHSESVHCENCCQKNHRDGRVSYYHQLMSAVMVHPDSKVVMPLASEAITKQDGAKKNDCERNAGKRILSKLKKFYPRLKMIVIEDGLHSNAPHIRELKSNGFSYIIGAKPKDHRWMFDWVDACKKASIELSRDGNTIDLKWVNDVPLNDSNQQLMVNYLECTETKKNGKVTKFTWVTDIHITKNNVYQIMRGGRARWKIENETFNTLKTQGYHFEHNFGHGKKHLSTVFAKLMMTAFLTDQIQQFCCPLFQKALAKLGRKLYLWNKMRHFFTTFLIDSWEALFHALANPPKPSLNDTG